MLGLYNCPTIVNNAETMAQVKHVLAFGGAEFAKIGIPGDSGTHIWCVSGLVKRPGLYEIEAGKATFGQLLYDFCGGPLDGRTFKAIIPGGSSTKILKIGERFKGKLPNGQEFDWAVEDIPLDSNSIAACGTGLGTGGTIVLDDSVEMIQALSNLNAFYAHGPAVSARRVAKVPCGSPACPSASRPVAARNLTSLCCSISRTKWLAVPSAPTAKPSRGPCSPRYRSLRTSMWNRSVSA